MEIYLIRHTSVDVPQGVCYGQTDVPLKPSFEQEAEIVKENLAAHTFDAVYTSPLSRCVRLATYCGYPDAQQDDRLKEMCMGDWEMQPFDAIKDPQLQEWYDNYLYVPTRNGESYQDLLTRVSSFFRELKSKAGSDHKIAVFAHGGVLLSAQIYAGVFNPENALQKLPSYGEIIKISI
ncbi:MAG TPA: alpha-ribazole phosphatase [Porphyromonadaceae bacterium]|nr:alpha-ribazole phosphatase [Porphyromonadaceae bacterium]